MARIFSHANDTKTLKNKDFVSEGNYQKNFDNQAEEQLIQESAKGRRGRAHG